MEELFGIGGGKLAFVGAGYGRAERGKDHNV